MIEIRRGRPPKDYSDRKELVTSVRLNIDDASTLRIIANRNGCSVYKYVESVLKDKIEEFHTLYDGDAEDYSTYPPDVDEDNDIEWVEV